MSAFRRAVALQDAGDAVGAEAAYREALRTEPSYAPAAIHSNLGMLHAAAGRHDEALSESHAAAALAPTNADVLYNLGNVLMGADAAVEAASAFSRALRAVPRHAPSLHNLGILENHLGRTSEARARFRAALARRRHGRGPGGCGAACRRWRPSYS